MCWFNFNHSKSIFLNHSSLFSTITISLASCSCCHTQVHIVGGSARDGTGALFAHLWDMHVLLQKSTVQVAALLKCSCGRLWSPLSSLYLFFSLALVYMPHFVLMVMYVSHAHGHMICKFCFYLPLWCCTYVGSSTGPFMLVWLNVNTLSIEMQWSVKVCCQVGSPFGWLHVCYMSQLDSIINYFILSVTGLSASSNT